MQHTGLTRWILNWAVTETKRWLMVDSADRRLFSSTIFTNMNLHKSKRLAKKASKREWEATFWAVKVRQVATPKRFAETLPH